MTSTDDFLAHYGVKGMKWGRRKADSTSKPQPSPEEAAKKAERRARVRKAVGLGMTALGLLALDAYAKMASDDDRVRASLHKKTTSMWEDSAYGQARRERSMNFVDNLGYHVYTPTYSQDLVRT